jgi:hypothetical protein
VTAAEIIAQVREHGGDVSLMPDRRRLQIVRRSQIPDNLAAEARAHVEELRTMLLAHEVIAVAENIATARAIREGRFPTPCSPADCGFHIGETGERCRRCGVAWADHFTS